MASIELKSISGKGIKSLSPFPFQKPSLYTVISLTNVNQPTNKNSQKKTTVDGSHGENPEWDQPIRFEIDGGPNQDLILQFELKAKALLGNRDVGRASIPVTDLDFSGEVQHVSYQLKSPDREVNGVINFSYQVDDPEEAVSPKPPNVLGRTLAANYSSEESFYPVSSFAPSAPPVSAYSPQPAAASDYNPAIDPVVAYPPLLPDVGGYYPPPAYPPQPASECCCRPIPQSAPTWHYQSEPACYYPSPAPNMYGYRQQGWDRGLYGYN